MKVMNSWFSGTALLAALASLTGLLPQRICASEFSLTNDQVVFTCKTKGGNLSPDTLKDKSTGQVIKLGGELFNLLLTNGDFIHSSDFVLAGTVRTEALAADPGASRFSERLPG